LNAAIGFMIIRLRYWVSAVGVITACNAGAIQPPAAHPPGHVEPCEIAGVGPAQCASVRVRESATAARMLDLQVVVLPAHASNPLPDPILPLAGGPGQGAADLAATFGQRFAPYRDQRDIVLVDQRGTGRSNGLRCESPHGTAELMGTLFDHARLPGCRNALQQTSDLAHYTTAIAARDYAAVLDHLGYRTVNVIGISYGSRLGLEIARQLPLRVRTLTIEGVVPPTFTWPSLGAADADKALGALIDDCARETACRQAFPRFGQDVELAFTRLRNEPAMVSVRDPATGATERVRFGRSDLAYATRGLLYGNDSLSLPLWFRNAAAGDFSALAQAYVNRARSLDAQIALGVHFGIYCAEDLPFVDWPAAEAAAQGTHLGGYLLDQYRRACDVWPRAPVDASFREPVQTSIPTLLMAGRRDPVTPPRTAEEAARTLPRSKLVIWPHGAHGNDGLASPDCRRSLMREFLRTADPDALPLDCVARDQPLPFRLR
jgi:pimeloyl-ACP methyl ester carboxylesterase